MSAPTPSDTSTSFRLGDLFLASFAKLSAVQPGERVLDIQAVDGSAALESVRRCTPLGGEAKVLDGDEQRLAMFRSRAQAEGFRDLETGLYQGGALSEPDSYWDVVQCHLALPLLDDIEGTLKESIRVLRPVGRFACSVWGSRERSPLLTIFLDAIAPHVPGTAALDKTLFRFAEAGKLARTLGEMGYEDAVPDRLTEWPVFESVEAYWAVMTAAEPFASHVRNMTAEQVADAKATIEKKTRFYRRPQGLELKIEGLVLASVK